ncbi:Non-structural maintenance of chromosomes element 4 [Sergentomyia squamirostris]
MENISQNANRRKKYQELLEIGSGINDNLDAEELGKTLQKVRDLTNEVDEMWKEKYSEKAENAEERAKNPNEVVMDIQVLKMNHELISKAMTTKGMSEFRDDEFINALKAQLVDPQGNWHFEKLVEVWGKQMRVLSGGGCSLLGAFSDIPNDVEKVVKQRAKRAKNDIGEEKKPEHVTKLKSEAKSSQRVNDVYKQILKLYEKRGMKDIPFYELVCDPNSFMRTIDNIFQVAFLCREGLTAIVESNEEGFPNVKPVKKIADSQIVKDTTQSISSINHSFWKKCVWKYNISNPLIVDSNRPSTSKKS